MAHIIHVCSFTSSDYPQSAPNHIPILLFAWYSFTCTKLVWILISISISIYIHIYIYRERERLDDICVYIYIYILYVYCLHMTVHHRAELPASSTDRTSRPREVPGRPDMWTCKGIEAINNGENC